MSTTERTTQHHYLTNLDTLLQSCSNRQLLAIIAEMIEYDPYAYQEMSKEELIAFIKENYNYVLTAEFLYQDDDEFID